jgi:hypothetical protein
VHTVERALAVGSITEIVEPREARAFLIERLEALAAAGPRTAPARHLTPGNDPAQPRPWR